MDKELASTLFYGDINIPVVALKEGSYRVGLLEVKFKPGMKTEIPYRVLQRLLEKKIVEVDVESILELHPLKKIQWMESRTKELTKLDEGFYVKAKLYFSHLREKARRDENAEIELAKAKVLFEDIVRLRLTKIARLAMADPTPSRDFMEKMTREERVFYAKLCHLISEWEKGLKALVEGWEK